MVQVAPDRTGLQAVSAARREKTVTLEFFMTGTLWLDAPDFPHCNIELPPLPDRMTNRCDLKRDACPDKPVRPRTQPHWIAVSGKTGGPSMRIVCGCAPSMPHSGAGEQCQAKNTKPRINFPTQRKFIKRDRRIRASTHFIVKKSKHHAISRRKLQAPTSKLQRRSKFQAPITNRRPASFGAN